MTVIMQDKLWLIRSHKLHNKQCNFWSFYCHIKATLFIHVQYWLIQNNILCTCRAILKAKQKVIFFNCFIYMLVFPVVRYKHQRKVTVLLCLINVCTSRD